MRLGSPSAIRRLTAIMCVAATSVTLLVFAPGRADAVPPQSWYTYGNSSCSTNKIDPLNIKWHDWRWWAVTEAVEWTMWLYVGWKNTSFPPSSPQWFNTHAGCKKQGANLTKGFNHKSHTRVFTARGPSGGADANVVAYGDAHRERVVGDPDCRVQVGPIGIPGASHAVYQWVNGRSGWQEGARELVQNLAGNIVSYPHSYTEWVRVHVAHGPAVRTFVQCNDDRPVWDGRQHWLTRTVMQPSVP